MKKIPLSGKKGSGKFALVDDEDFEVLNKRKWHSGKAGYPATLGYFKTKERRPIMMHAVILDLKKGELADHKDSDPLNNQKSNLRRCTKQQNGMNKTKSVGKSSQYKGVTMKVTFYKGKPYAPYYSSFITINNKYIHLGTFKDEVEAAKAYDQKANELFGEFAKLNFPPNPPPL